MAHNGAQWLAPLLNGASKKQWQKVPAISFFQQRANGAMAATRVYQKRESE
jgi:hypothetical protein